MWVHRACYAWLKLDCRPSDAVKDEVAILSKVDFSKTNPCSFCNDTCSLEGDKRQSFKIKCGGVQAYPLIRHGRVWQTKPVIPEECDKVFHIECARRAWLPMCIG